MPEFNNDIFEVFENSGPMDDAVEVLEEMVPGAELVVVMPNEEEAKELVKKEKDSDWENDGDHSKFMNYIRKRLDNIPKHTGQTTVGCERAIAYLKRIDREISRAIQSDDNNVIDEERPRRSAILS